MKTKYMSLIKKVILCLVVLLFVVCFSLSSSFSSFIYESNDHRAVEMIANKLSYSIKINNMNTNKITIKPGGNIINMDVKSLNKVDTYYKLLYKNDDNLVVYNLSDNISGSIKSNEEKTIKLLVLNNTQNSINCTFDISGGYITRTLDEVIIANNYSEINNSLLVGDHIEYHPSNTYELDGKYFGEEGMISLSTIDTRWQIYDISDKGEIIIISENNISFDSYKLTGAYGYNNAVNLLNDVSKNLYSSDNSLEVRNINLEDVESKFNETLVRYGDNIEYVRELTSINYPTLWEYEKNTIINNENTNGSVHRSESYIINDVNSKQTTQVVVKDLITNSSEHELINGYLSTRYVYGNGKNIEWGIFSIKNGKVELNPLYDSLGKENDIPFTIRPIVKLSPNYIAN
ncbi:MAG: hypothetical protein IKR57_06505 [Bacilli bacterium]|nr:hypothetical protein [Bacilli bacterium]